MITRKSEYTCQSCLDLIKKNESIEAEKKLKETIKSLRGAIKNKKWEELNRFEFKILYNIVQEDNFRSFLNKYRYKDSDFWAAIFKLRDLDLIVLEYARFGSSVTNIQFLRELSEVIPTPLNKQDNNDKNVSFNKETNELRFKLTKNSNTYSYDSPEYSGTLEFQQNVVLKSGIEYSFGAWKRQNDVLYLSIIPTEDKPLLPKQKNKAW